MIGGFRSCASKPSKQRVELTHVVSLRPLCVAFEKSSRRRRPRQTVGLPHLHRRQRTTRGNSRHSILVLETRGHLRLHRVPSRYQPPQHLAIPATSCPMNLDHPKSRLGRQPMEQRGLQSRPSKNHPICFFHSRRSWAHFRFSSRTMMLVFSYSLVLLTADCLTANHR